MEPARSPCRCGQRLHLLTCQRRPAGPKDMQGDAGADAGPAMHLAGVAELLFDGGGRAGCRNFPKRVPVLANPQEGSSI